MKTISFEKRYFANEGEWDYFLSQCGIKEEVDKHIYEVTITCSSADIDITFDE